jgi:hypothetical protein
MRYTLKILFLFLIQFSIAQTPYPQDYFRSPLDVTLILSGTFAELRSNHFHSGLDIKTQQREGLNVYAAAEGYVSRIKISHYGYGKALYITHPNGYTTVYAHLKKFAPRVEDYIKKLQYEKESFEIEVFPDNETLPIASDEIVAYSGNTGGSGGPHLHFEIRDKEERPINPMLFGIDIKDSQPPKIISAFAYPISGDAHINESTELTKLRLKEENNGTYTVENIKAYGKIGFGIETYDRQDLAANKNGVSNIQTFFNGNKNFEIDFKRFSFDETQHLNRLIDYEYYENENTRIQKLFVQQNNPLSLYKDVDSNGYVQVEDSTSSVYKVRVKDFKDNDSWITINIKGEKIDALKPKYIKATDYFVYADQSTTLEKENVSVYIPSNTFYDDFFIDFNVVNDTLTIHEPIIPLQKNMVINFDVSDYKEEDKNKLYIGRLSKYGNKIYYVSAIKKENTLTAFTKTLGTYTIGIDNDEPSIKPVNFQEGKWLSKYRYLTLKIDDKTSGVKSYRATINGKWILMEYDYKKNTLVYDFNDDVIKNETKYNLKVIVTDNVGNSSTFETIFYRK